MHKELKLLIENTLGTSQKSQVRKPVQFILQAKLA